MFRSTVLALLLSTIWLSPSHADATKRSATGSGGFKPQGLRYTGRSGTPRPAITRPLGQNAVLGRVPTRPVPTLAEVQAIPSEKLVRMLNGGQRMPERTFSALRILAHRADRLAGGGEPPPRNPYDSGADVKPEHIEQVIAENLDVTKPAQAALARAFRSLYQHADRYLKPTPNARLTGHSIDGAVGGMPQAFANYNLHGAGDPHYRAVMEAIFLRGNVGDFGKLEKDIWVQSWDQGADPKDW